MRSELSFLRRPEDGAGRSREVQRITAGPSNPREREVALDRTARISAFAPPLRITRGHGRPPGRTSRRPD